MEKLRQIKKSGKGCTRSRIETNQIVGVQNALLSNASKPLRRTIILDGFDDPSANDLCRRRRFLLETDGFDVRTFRSAAALLSGSMIGEANCFVIDYKMPFMNGIDLASRLRDRHLDAPIVLVTGYPDGNIEAKAAAAGIRHVLLKPHLEETLVSRIRNAIQEDSAAGR